MSNTSRYVSVYENCFRAQYASEVHKMIFLEVGRGCEIYFMTQCQMQILLEAGLALNSEKYKVADGGNPGSDQKIQNTKQPEVLISFVGLLMCVQSLYQIF
jgi:hypothetical protein